MGKDWRKEFDDLLKARRGGAEQPDADADALPEEPVETQPPADLQESPPESPAETQPPADLQEPPQTVEPEPVPEPIAQEHIEIAPESEGRVEETAPPVLVEPESSLEDFGVEAAVPDTFMRAGFSKAVEHIFHELVNQLGQVREIARRRIQVHGLWHAQQDEEAERMLKEEEDAFFRAVEKMFRDIRENYAERLRRITDEEKQTAAALDETRQRLEQRQQELGLAQSDLESAQSRVRELGTQIEHLLDQLEAKPHEAYVAELEARLQEAYILLIGIEETFLVAESGAVA